MLGVKCGWSEATVAEQVQFPEATAFHRSHDSDDLSGCDAWRCQCGNEAHLDGFQPCNTEGQEMEPGDGWPGLYICGKCGVILTERGEVYRAAPEAPKS